ncbi:MAG: hypothetical protein K1X75_06125 [Leptospirales bacterium]|nr:hypothetical protein [Leptospirales bacterium]
MRTATFAIAFYLLGAASLAAQTPPNPDGGEVQADAANVWAGDGPWRCDFREMHIGPPESFHAMWIGDSVGALLGAAPYGPVFRVGSGTGAIVTKRWENFMTNPPPRTGGAWRILNTSVSGNVAFNQRQWVEGCLGTGATPQTVQRFRDSTPGRVIMEIGGNEFRYGRSIPGYINPHYAHYQVNASLNNIGRMIALLQQNGRTVLLVGYHPYRASNVVDELSLDDPNLIEQFCGAYTEDVEVLNASTGLVCSVGGALQKVISAAAKPFFDAINKYRGWLYDRLGYTGFNRGIIPFVQYNSDLMRFCRGVDLSLGRFLGMNSSLTGLFEDPAARFQHRNERGLNGYFDRLKPGMPWMDFWNLIQETPRYETGWAVMFALPNKDKAVSAMIVMLGRRMQENYIVQGVPIPGTNRRTVEYVSMEPYFRHPGLDWAGRNELYQDSIHPNNAGAALWAQVIAQKMASLEYDVYLSDFEFTKNTWRDWSELPENPFGEDLGLLVLCFFFGICK